ncbi:MAG: hypothetical protein ACXAB2_12610 [Candidatus Hodarchaeales archaeon]|jgi:hypothetical protein
MYWVSYGEFKQLKNIDYLKWFQKNRTRIEESLVDGMKLIDFYVVINSTADHDFEMWFEIDNWAVLDRERDNPKAVKLNQEMFEEMGIPIKWMRTKALRTISDTKDPFGRL